MSVIITGAGRGIGKAIALKFAAQGEELILCAKSAETIENAKQEILIRFPNTVIHTFHTDLSEKAAVKEFGAFCLTKGTPGVLINNAGSYIPGKCINEDEGVMEQMMNINFYSAYYLTRFLLPSMMAVKQGHIFNICSIASLQAYEGGGGYSVSKFALHGFSNNLRHELKPHGIKVTSVFPGAVFTDSWAGYDNSSNRIMEAGDIAEMVFAATKLSTQAVVEDIVIRPQLGDL